MKALSSEAHQPPRPARWGWTGWSRGWYGYMNHEGVIFWNQRHGHGSSDIVDRVKKIPTRWIRNITDVRLFLPKRRFETRGSPGENSGLPVGWRSPAAGAGWGDAASPPHRIITRKPWINWPLLEIISYDDGDDNNISLLQRVSRYLYSRSCRGKYKIVAMELAVKLHLHWEEGKQLPARLQSLHRPQCVARMTASDALGCSKPGSLIMEKKPSWRLQGHWISTARVPLQQPEMIRSLLRSFSRIRVAQAVLLTAMKLER